MARKQACLCAIFSIGWLLSGPLHAAPVGPAFTYQGLLTDGGAAVSGTCDFRFRLYDMAAGGNQVGATLTFDGQAPNPPAIDIVDGLFLATLNFGAAAINGQERWLQIEVRCPSGNGEYTPLSDRQPLTATPHATFAANAGGFALPFAGTYAGADTTAVSITQTGTGGAGLFRINNANSYWEALTVSSNGTGPALNVIHTGNGYGVQVQNLNSGSNLPSIFASTMGGGAAINGQGGANGYGVTGSASGPGNGVQGSASGTGNAIQGTVTGNNARAGFFRVTSANHTGNAVEINTAGADVSQALYALHSGMGDCGLFEITNAANQGEVVEARSNGSGDVVQAVNTGTGRAGYFQISNTASAQNALYSTNNATNVNVSAIAGINTGGGRAATFQITNAASTAPALFATTNGAGPAIRATWAHVDRISVGTATIPTGVRVAVDGKMLCEEVEVQLSQDWPDYVFDEGHDLMPLDELEQHIACEKRLPGIPSATEVAKDGLQIGEMQAKTMEKVEELTLYVLQLNRELSSIRIENAQLKQRVASLEAAAPTGGAR